MDDECIQALDSIENDAAKIQAVCKLAVDPGYSKTDPDIQTALYIIIDYAKRIKTTASKVMM